MKKNQWKIIGAFLLIAAFSSLLGFFYTYHWPQAKSWARIQIAEKTKDQAFHVLPGNISVSAIPLALHLHKVQFRPQQGNEEFMKPFTIQKLSFRIGIESFLSGHFRLAEIGIRGVDLDLRLKREKKTPPQKLPEKDEPLAKKLFPDLKLSRELFLQALDIPLQSVTIKKAQIKVQYEATPDTLEIYGLNLLIDNRSSAAYIELDIPKLSYIKQIKDNKPVISTVALETRTLIEPDRLSIPSFKLHRSKSFVVASGTTELDISKLEAKNAQLNLRTRIGLSEAQQWALALYPELKLPNFYGTLNFETELRHRGKLEAAAFQVNGSNLKIDNYIIGKVQGVGTVDQNNLRIPSIQIKNRLNDIFLHDLNLELSNKFKFKTTAEAKSFELHQLLKDINVGDIPVHLRAKTKIPCEGQLKKGFFVKCEGRVKVTNFLAHSGNINKPVTTFEEADLQGHVVVDSKEVRIESEIFIGDDRGRAYGKVEYANGFRFDYESPNFSFKNLTNLANLKFEGSTSIRGHIEGNSKYATFVIDLLTDNFWFEDYGIGKAKTTLLYKKGSIYLNNIHSNFNNSIFKGNTRINLLDETISAKIHSPKFELGDLQQAFSRKTQLPFEAYGLGSANVEVSGPFEFTKLTYKLNASASRLLVANETFDQLSLNIQAQKGQVRLKDFLLTKGDGRAQARGKGFPSGQIDVNVEGRDFYLEQSQFLNSIGLKVAGQNDYRMTIKGHVFEPTVKVDGELSELSIASAQFPSSKYKLELHKTYIVITGNFFEEQIKIDAQIPFSKNLPFRFNSTVEDFDFSPLLAITSDVSRNGDYSTKVSFVTKLESPSNWLWNARGQIDLKNLRIQRGLNELYLENPASILFDKGQMNLKEIVLNGDNTLLKINAKNSRKDNLNIGINGKVETSLISFLTPFLSELRGVLSISADIRGSANNAKIIGSAFIDGAYAQLADFPHPFEDIRSDILFNESRIIINHFQSRFTSGKISGDGSVNILGLREFDTRLNISMKNGKLRIPEGVVSEGDAELSITGRWFPFLLKGDYFVKSAMIRKEFDDENGGAGKIKRSIYLPEYIIKGGKSQTLNLDINTFVDRNASIKNSLIDAEMFGNIRILGTPEEPRFLGDIQLGKGGEFFFRDTPFEISAAQFRFKNTEDINPEMYLTASSRVKEYDITLTVQGTAKNYQIQFQSTPPLSEQDIISLLALGVTNSEMEQISSDEQLNKNSYEIGSAIISQNPLGKAIKEKTGFEFKFSSAVDDTDDVDSPKAVPKVIISRQWTPKIGTSLSRTLGDTATQDFKVEYQLNEKISVIGSWEDKESQSNTETQGAQEESTDVLGIDLRYRIEFK